MDSELINMDTIRVDCPCGFAKNLKVTKCPVCGTDLSPLFKIKALPMTFYKKGISFLDDGDIDKATGSFKLALELKEDFIEVSEKLREIEELKRIGKKEDIKKKTPVFIKPLFLTTISIFGIFLFCKYKRK